MRKRRFSNEYSYSKTKVVYPVESLGISKSKHRVMTALFTITGFLLFLGIGN